jgi:hypothetical protein
MMRLWVAKDIERDWWLLSEILAPAVRYDGKRTMGGVHDALLTGDFALFTINEISVNLVAVAELHQIDAGKCLSLIYLAGHIGPFSPRQWINRMRQMMTSYAEEVAKAMNCVETRVEGRDWSRVFPDWECINPETHELRKALV